MSISIGIKEYQWPDYINDIYKELGPEARELILKALIHMVITKKENQYYIIPFVSGMSNRCEIQKEISGPASALVLTASLVPWTYNERLEVKPYTCPCCGKVFDSREKSPKCELCGKYDFEEQEQ